MSMLKISHKRDVYCAFILGQFARMRTFAMWERYLQRQADVNGLTTIEMDTVCILHPAHIDNMQCVVKEVRHTQYKEKKSKYTV